MKTANINTSNTLAWDSSNSNNWARPATLNTYLNGTYLNSLSSEAQGQIVASDYSIGAVTGSNNDLADQVNDENSKTWNGKIALPTLSEYLRTNSNSNCKTFSTYISNYSTCKNMTWMFNSGNWRTLSPYFDSPYSVLGLSNDGYLINDGAADTYPAYHLTVTLSPEIQVTGDGSQSNPYEISL